MWSHSVPQQREVSKRFILLTDHIEQCTGFQGIRNNALFLSTILVLNSTIMFTNSNNVRPSLEKYAEAIFFFLFNVESGLVLGRYLAKISEERFNFSEFTKAAQHVSLVANQIFFAT